MAEQMFILIGEMYMGSCYFFAGTLLLWQQIQSARDPAVGDGRRAGAVIWTQQGQPPSSTPSRSQGGATAPGPICCRRGRPAAVLGRVGRHNSRGQHPSAGPGLCHQAGQQQTAPGSTRGRTSASARRSQASARGRRISGPRRRWAPHLPPPALCLGRAAGLG